MSRHEEGLTQESRPWLFAVWSASSMQGLAPTTGGRRTVEMKILLVQFLYMDLTLAAMVLDWGRDSEEICDVGAAPCWPVHI